MSANLTKLHYRGNYEAEYAPWFLSIQGAAKVLGIDMSRDLGPPTLDDVMSAYPTVTDIHVLDTKLNEIQHEYWITNTEVYHLIYETLIFDPDYAEMDRAYLEATYRAKKSTGRLSAYFIGKALFTEISDKHDKHAKDNMAKARTTAYNQTEMEVRIDTKQFASPIIQRYNAWGSLPENATQTLAKRQPAAGAALHAK